MANLRVSQKDLPSVSRSKLWTIFQHLDTLFDELDRIGNEILLSGNEKLSTDLDHIISRCRTINAKLMED